MPELEAVELEDLAEEDFDRIFRVNAKSVFLTARHVVPGMKAQGGGAILNVASTAGMQPLPYSAGYSAAKAYVLTFSEALHQELHGSGVTVTVLAPGPVTTDFWEISGWDVAGGQSFERSVPRPAWVTAEEADVVRKKADTLMRQGLALLRLRQVDAFQRKFSEAAALEPEQVRADFLLALIFTMGRDVTKALPFYQKCLLRDPENIAVLNNVAMVAVGKGDYNTALTNWRHALDSQPDQRVVHNVGRFLEQCAKDTDDALVMAVRNRGPSR